MKPKFRFFLFYVKKSIVLVEAVGRLALKSRDVLMSYILHACLIKFEPCVIPVFLNGYMTNMAFLCGLLMLQK